MSKKYPIYAPEFTGKDLYYQRRWEDTLEAKIEELKPKYRLLEKWKDKPDEEIEGYIIQMFSQQNLARVKVQYVALAGNAANDPRNVDLQQYSAEEIIEMSNDGLNIPKDVLDWAYAQITTDFDNLSDCGSGAVTDTDVAEGMENSSNLNTAQQDKEELQKYAVQAQVQEEFIQKSEEQIIKDSEAIDEDKNKLEKEQKDAQMKIEDYKNEHDSIEQKIKDGEELSDSEIGRYKQLDSAINAENQELIVKSKEFESELASLDSEIKTMDNLAESSEIIENEMNTSLDKYNNTSKYSSKYINSKNLNTKFNNNFAQLIYSSVTGNLGHYSLSSLSSFSLSLKNMKMSAVNVENSSNSSAIFVDSIVSAETPDATADLDVTANNQETKDAENSEITPDENNTIAQNENEIANPEQSPEGIQENNVEGKENSQPEIADITDINVTENQQDNNEDTVLTAADSKEIASSRSVSENKNSSVNEVTENKADSETDNDAATSEVQKDENSVDETEEENKDSAEIMEENEVAASETEEKETQETDEVQQPEIKAEDDVSETDTAISSRYSDEPDTSEAAEVQTVTDKKAESESATTEEKTSKEIADNGEIQRKDMQKVFAETDSNPEERGIETNRDASRRDSSFSDAETSIAASNNELEVLEHKALKHNTASISAKNSTTSIGETDYVINADGGASISGQGGSLSRDNNVNETSESLKQLAQTRDEAESVNNDINIQLASLNNLSGRNMSSVTTSSNAPVQPDSSNNSEPLNQITRDISNSSTYETNAFRQAKNAEETGQSVIDNSTSEIEKNETKNEIGHSNEKFVSEDIDDESYDEVNAETIEEVDTNEVTRYSDMAAPGIMEEEIPANNMAYDGLTAKIAEQDMSNAISENMQSISEEILKVESTQTLANNNAQDILNTRSVEAAKSSILTYGEKVQQKDNNTEIKRKVLTAFEIKRRDQIKRGVEKVSSSAKMKH